MKRAIWGTGYNASKFFVNFGEGFIDFFIDSDKSKQGTYLGKAVLHPSDIYRWGGLFVYVPDNYYQEIKIFLEDRGLKEYVDFEPYGSTSTMNGKQAWRDYLCAVKRFDGMRDRWKQDILFIAGHSIIKKEYQRYIPILARNLGKVRVISSAYWMESDEVQAKWKTEAINSPKILEDYTRVIHQSPSRLSRRKHCSSLEATMTQLENMYDDADRDSYFLQACLMRRYFQRVLSSMRPSHVIAYTSISPSRSILRNLCAVHHIPLIFTHLGILPGTLSFDVHGEMGESIVATQWKGFLELPVDDCELEHAGRVWRYLYQSRLNRKVQPKGNFIAYLRSRIVPGRPVVFFAGQHDAFSHMVPYTMATERHHSPAFRSSLEAVCFVGEICRRNHWNLIYKPHPMYTRTWDREQLPSDVIFLESGDIHDVIDMADVTVTILSSVNYVSLIRRKPVVMLGYNQISGKGCSYEALGREKIEDALSKAIRYGFTVKQEAAFLKHLAQCLKYYLYDDLQDRPIRYGRPVAKQMDEFYRLDHLLESIPSR